MKKLIKAVVAIKKSEYLMNSPVACMVALLDMYMQGSLSPA